MFPEHFSPKSESFSAKKPKQLFQHTTPKDTFGGQQWKGLTLKHHFSSRLSSDIRSWSNCKICTFCKARNANSFPKRHDLQNVHGALNHVLGYLFIYGFINCTIMPMVKLVKLLFLLHKHHFEPAFKITAFLKISDYLCVFAYMTTLHHSIVILIVIR